MTLAVVESLSPVLPSPLSLTPLVAPWETPPPPAHVATHLLFSVLLV
jgi:hypothetical protein